MIAQNKINVQGGLVNKTDIAQSHISIVRGGF